MAAARIKTKKVTDRRSLRFNSMDDLLRDIEALDAHLRAGGTIRTTGNWTAAQIVEHVTKIIDMSIEGFDFVAPWPLRLYAKFTRERFLTKGFPLGLPIVSRMKSFEPPPASNISWEQAVAHLRRTIEGLQGVGGRRMSQPSPMFGAMSHDDWVRMHCRHAENHFSFMQPAAG